MSHCECGRALKGGRRRTGCVECGRLVCRACAIAVRAVTYCRWCARAASPTRVIAGRR
ncbi:MAG: hypothetical protein HY294_08645 [Candidatus Rokubacteria bacterium]|nr:hypothetical protein [Candidatus Rokubacteria bacterium]MBI3826051.1 hypothetical protein [Candidatus Rokubacteria bacterium]